MRLAIMAVTTLLTAGMAQGFRPKGYAYVPPPKVPETLRIGTQTLALFTLPLESNEKAQPPKMRRNPYSPRFFADGHSRACGRGYVSSWEIAGDSLFLTGIRSCTTPASLRLDSLGPVDGQGRMFAGWYSGALRMGTGNPLGADSDDYPPYSVEYEISITNGKVGDILASATRRATLAEVVSVAPTPRPTPLERTGPTEAELRELEVR